MNPTHLIITNRSATAEGWIHIVPKGELPNREAGIVQVLDDAALDSILANIAKDRERLGEKWPGIYAGREHFIYDDDQDSAALAWFKEFEKRADGIWAKADGLTDIGHEAIKNSRYKFTSFVADRKDTQKLGGDKVRILKIDTIGFTNQANGKELLSPITNRHGGRGAVTLPGSREPGANQTPNQKPMTMKSIAQKLGLSPEASEDAILGEVTKLQNRLTTLEPLEAENTKLKNRIAESDTEQCETLLDACGIKADDKRRAHLVNSLKLLKNRDERLAHLADFEIKPLEAKDAKTTTRVLNRKDGKGGEQEVDANDERSKADKIANRAHELKGQNPKRSFDECFTQARTEAAKAN